MATEITKINPLSFSIVIIWKNQLNQLPLVSQVFAETIFDNTQKGIYNLTRDGIQVTFPPKITKVEEGMVLSVAPLVHIAFDRLHILHTDINILFSAFEKLKSEFKTLNAIGYLIPGQLGLNIEYEVAFSAGHAQEYLNNRFGKFKSNNYFEGVGIGEIKIALAEPGEMKMINVTLQPRVGANQAFFIKINDHFSKLPFSSFPTTVEVRKQFEQSQEKFENKVLPYLNLFNNEQQENKK